MNILILHDKIPADARADELDALTQAEVISEALRGLGHRSSQAAFSFNLEESKTIIQQEKPDAVVNLVESVNGSGRWVYLAPALLDELDVPYTGSGTTAMFLTANKLLTKRLLRAHGIATPAWMASGENGFRAVAFMPPIHRPDESGRSEARGSLPGRYIIKSVWEEASVGLDEDSVIWADEEKTLTEAIASRLGQLGGQGFAEEFIDGREFNLSILADEHGPQVLPPAEIDFVDYAPDKPKVVGYRAKWDADSFEFHHTPRRFDFPAADAPLLEKLSAIALDCWNIFDLRGYVRVDFRVDRDGKPWVLEVNANPCLSPDAGFFAAAQQAGLEFKQIVERILADALSSQADIGIS